METRQRDGARHATVARAPVSHLARTVLSTFLATFLLTRITVFLILSRRMPDLYLHIGGTHVHHLNYGIFLLSILAGYLLFRQPRGASRSAAAVAYGVGLALTFDEFGMWLHLGGGYWQRASFDAVAVIAAVLTLIVVAPRVRLFRPGHWAVAVLLAMGLLVFAAMFVESFRYMEHSVAPRLERLERAGPG